jgi:cell fate regulator YaaT (PSP1 superfamily)
MEIQTEENTIPNNISLSRGCCIVQHANGQNQKINQGRCCKLSTFNWLNDVKDPAGTTEIYYVEVRFKNGRKEFFSFPQAMTLEEGELVAVEASPGHDIGIVSLTGDLVRLQMERKHADLERKPVKRIFRHARTADVEKWIEALSLEDSTMYKTRVIALDLGLEMKINDVEYQGDKSKAIFYYTANDRVDFRELIRKLADTFHVRIEMRQIGVRQESAKVGGIGSCGRELCCTSWMSGFQSVSTSSARIQQLSLNPQKLAGQCGKLKCCLNYEVDAYADALKSFPDNGLSLKTKKGEAFHQKTDVFKKIMWYSYADDSNNMMAIPVDSVKNILSMNVQGKLPKELEEFALKKEQKDYFEASLEQDLSKYI